MFSYRDDPEYKASSPKELLKKVIAGKDRLINVTRDILYHDGTALIDSKDFKDELDIDFSVYELEMQAYSHRRKADLLFDSLQSAVHSSKPEIIATVPQLKDSMARHEQEATRLESFIADSKIRGLHIKKG
jgi:hypothetical protein